MTVPATTLSVVVIARGLQPSSYGHYVYLTFVVTVAGALVDLGIGSSLFWTAALRRDESQVSQSVRGSMTWALVRGPIAGVPVLVLEQGLASWAVFTAVVVMTVSGAWGSALVAGRYFKLASTIAAGGTTLATVASTSVALLSGSPTWTLATLLGVRGCFSCLLIYLRADARLRKDLRTPGPLRLDKASQRYALSNYVSTVSAIWVTSRSEVVFLKSYDQLSVAGAFGVATTVASRSTLLTDALFAPLNSMFVEITQRDKRVGELQLLRSLRIGAALGIVTAVLVLPLGAVLTPVIFGSSYKDVAGPAVALTAVSVLGTALGAIHPWIQAGRRTAAIVVPNLLAAAVDVLLCILLIPAHPLAGAVVANVTAGATLIVGALLMAGLSRRTLRAHLQVGGLVAVVILGCSLASLLLRTGRVLADLPLSMGGCLATCALLLRLLPPVLHSDDLEVLAQVAPQGGRPTLMRALAVLGLFRRLHPGVGETAPIL